MPRAIPACSMFSRIRYTMTTRLILHFFCLLLNDLRAALMSMISIQTADSAVPSTPLILLLAANWCDIEYFSPLYLRLNPARRKLPECSERDEIYRQGSSPRVYGHRLSRINDPHAQKSTHPSPLRHGANFAHHSSPQSR